LEKIKRGRNTVSEEAELQSAFFEASLELANKDIAVPMPYYEIEIFATQMIAMERLHAKSADEILTGKATLPGWFDVDRFCNSLTRFIDAMHAKNLYHRDLHFGNIMISQRPTWQEGQPLGYVIDFGLSSYALENMEPYKKEVADTTFTYDDDYGRINLLRKSLKALQLRTKGTRYE
jgi:tRNA A-37 threonylcarbamoyl transferase component Bud32